MVKLERSRKVDLSVRGWGAAMLLLSASLIAILPALRGADVRAQPDVAALCIAFAAFCSGSLGASFLAMGRQLFLPLPAPEARSSAHSQSQ